MSYNYNESIHQDLSKLPPLSHGLVNLDDGPLDYEYDPDDNDELDEEQDDQETVPSSTVDEDQFCLKCSLDRTYPAASLGDRIVNSPSRPLLSTRIRRRKRWKIELKWRGYYIRQRIRAYDVIFLPKFLHLRSKTIRQAHKLNHLKIKRDAKKALISMMEEAELKRAEIDQMSTLEITVVQECPGSPLDKASESCEVIDSVTDDPPIIQITNTMSEDASSSITLTLEQDETFLEDIFKDVCWNFINRGTCSDVCPQFHYPPHWFLSKLKQVTPDLVSCAYNKIKGTIFHLDSFNMFCDAYLAFKKPDIFVTLAYDIYSLRPDKVRQAYWCMEKLGLGAHEIMDLFVEERGPPPTDLADLLLIEIMTDNFVENFDLIFALLKNRQTKLKAILACELLAVAFAHVKGPISDEMRASICRGLSVLIHDKGIIDLGEVPEFLVRQLGPMLERGS